MEYIYNSAKSLVFGPWSNPIQAPLWIDLTRLCAAQQHYNPVVAIGFQGNLDVAVMMTMTMTML